MAAETLITVRLETFSWISASLGMPENGRRQFQRKLKEGAVLTDLFQDLAAAYPEFGIQIYDPAKGWTSNEVMIIVNHKLIQASEMAHLRLKDNDEVSLSPVLVGG
jgi:molybdopterin converting factor small subunit